jgi:hypothetical protein
MTAASRQFGKRRPTTSCSVHRRVAARIPQASRSNAAITASCSVSDKSICRDAAIAAA